MGLKGKKTDYLCEGGQQQQDMILEHGVDLNARNEYKYLRLNISQTGTVDGDNKERNIQRRNGME